MQNISDENCSDLSHFKENDQVYLVIFYKQLLDSTDNKIQAL